MPRPKGSKNKNKRAKLKQQKDRKSRKKITDKGGKFKLPECPRKLKMPEKKTKEELDRLQSSGDANIKRKETNKQAARKYRLTVKQKAEKNELDMHKTQKESNELQRQLIENMTIEQLLELAKEKGLSDEYYNLLIDYANNNNLINNNSINNNSNNEFSNVFDNDFDMNSINSTVLNDGYKYE